MPAFLNPEHIITTAGAAALWVVALVVFAECGIFSILPGDSLLFAVGMFCSVAGSGGRPLIHYFGSEVATLLFCIGVLIVAAVAGNVSGYYIGRLIGPPLFKPRTGLIGKLFDPKYVAKTHDFFDRYGSKALILARFVPFVRTFVTLIAGVGKMPPRDFFTYTAIGGVLWVGVVTTLGFFLGQVSLIKNNLEIALLAVVFISLIPMVVEYLRERAKYAAKATA